MSNLRHTPVGATVTVRKIEGEGATRRRIMDMGIPAVRRSMSAR